jgi:hypothetical protein
VGAGTYLCEPFLNDDFSMGDKSFLLLRDEEFPRSPTIDQRVHDKTAGSQKIFGELHKKNSQARDNDALRYVHCLQNLQRIVKGHCGL